MSFVCSHCGKRHDDELPALAFMQPDYWLTLSNAQRAEGSLTADDCVTPDGHFFIRCSLELPIRDRAGQKLTFGVWSTLSEENYKRYADAFFDEDQSKLGSMFGWFSNEMGGNFRPTLNLKCHVKPQDHRQRPLIELEQSDHLLAVAQREGIWFAHVERLLHESGAYET
jgi:hypothetical protein